MLACCREQPKTGRRVSGLAQSVGNSAAAPTARRKSG